MHKSVARGAIVGATVALLFLLSTRVRSEWSVVALLAVIGLGAAGLFARLYVREPPSLERFRWLCTYGLASAAMLTLGALVAAHRLVAGNDPFTRLMILAVGAASILVGLFGFVVWHAIAVRNYATPRPGHPDFEEDALGNPVRREDPDQDG
jgi:hypothetical protein